MGIFDGITSGLFGNGGDESSQLAIEEWNRIKPPTIEEQKLLLEEFKSAGKLTPEMEQAIIQSDTELGGIAEDSRLRDAQLNALMSLQDIGQNGRTLQDKVNQQEVQNTLDSEARGRNEAVMQSLAQRGMTGSGMELANMLSNEQSQANRASQQGMNIDAQSQMRALEALSRTGQFGGDVRAQDYGISRDRASAQDAISRFNSANRQNVEQRNVGYRNTAQESNLNNQQDIFNKNTNLANAQQEHNKGLFQTQFGNQATLAGGKSGALQYDSARKDKERQSDIGITSDLIQGAVAYGSGGKK